MGHASAAQTRGRSLLLPIGDDRRRGQRLRLECARRVEIASAAGWGEVVAVWGSEADTRYRVFLADMGGALGSLQPEPHWRLAWLGVEPGRQGQGLGGALVRQMTARADAEGVACWLFTFTPRNVPIYEHLGFGVTLETLLPASRLRLWVMTRRPLAQP